MIIISLWGLMVARADPVDQPASRVGGVHRRDHGSACSAPALEIDPGLPPANSSVSAEHWWVGTTLTRHETFATLTSAMSLLDDHAVRASAMFAPAHQSAYWRDRLDVFDVVLSQSAPILPADTLRMLRHAYDICKRVALSALGGVWRGHELLRYAEKTDLFMLRLLRYSGDSSDGEGGRGGSRDLEPHTDPGLYTLHIPLGDDLNNFGTFAEQSSFFPGEQAEWLTAGAVRAVTHGGSGRHRRSAMVLFLHVDADAAILRAGEQHLDNSAPGKAGMAKKEKLRGETPPLQVPSLTDLSAQVTITGKVIAPSPAPLQVPARMQPAVAAVSITDDNNNNNNNNKSSAHAMPGLDLASIRVYWRLLHDLNEGDERAPSLLPSVVGTEGKTWWSSQIEVYRAWLAAIQATADEHGKHAGFNVPPPPRVIRWLWVAHMLQPKAYALDCANIFGGLLPHNNTVPVWEHPSAAFRAWWARFAGDTYPAFSVRLDRPGLRVDWWKGLDSSSVLYGDMIAKHAAFSDDDGTDALTQYKRFVMAMDTAITSGRSSVMLGPGTLLDFVWHAHQCDPVAYGDFNSRREQVLGTPFFDHEPCGELNPPDPQWLVNTHALWAELFPGVDPPVTVTDAGRCCAAPTPIPASLPLPNETKRVLKNVVVRGAVQSSKSAAFMGQYSTATYGDLFRYNDRPLYRKPGGNGSELCISSLASSPTGSSASWRVIECDFANSTYDDVLAKGINFIYATDPFMRRDPTELEGAWFGFNISGSLVEQPSIKVDFKWCPAGSRCEAELVHKSPETNHTIQYCVACKVGRFMPTSTGNCMPKEWNDDGGWTTDCLECPDHLHVPNSTACVACPPGQHTAAHNEGDKLDFLRASSSIEWGDDPGRDRCFRFTEVAICPRHHYWNNGSTTCEDCSMAVPWPFLYKFDKYLYKRGINGSKSMYQKRGNIDTGLPRPQKYQGPWPCQSTESCGRGLCQAGELEWPGLELETEPERQNDLSRERRRQTKILVIAGTVTAVSALSVLALLFSCKRCAETVVSAPSVPGPSGGGEALQSRTISIVLKAPACHVIRNISTAIKNGWGGLTVLGVVFLIAGGALLGAAEKWRDDCESFSLPTANADMSVNGLPVASPFSVTCKKMDDLAKGTMPYTGMCDSDRCRHYGYVHRYGCATATDCSHTLQMTELCCNTNCAELCEGNWDRTPAFFIIGIACLIAGVVFIAGLSCGVGKCWYVGKPKAATAGLELGEVKPNQAAAQAMTAPERGRLRQL
jgi:hypothetical protein